MKIKNKFGKFMLYVFGSILPENGFLSKRLRRHWARFISKSISKKANVHKGAKITGDGLNLQLSDYSEIGVKCQVGSGTHIGMHTMMGPECIILTQNHTYNAQENRFLGYEHKDVYIGEYSWIGTRCIILAGARIGSHCIVGAGSIVTNKQFPDYTLIAGNPAKVVKYLNHDYDKEVNK